MPAAATPSPPPARPALAALDFTRRPFLVIWETTQACDLACVHCRANATPARDAGELDTAEAMRLMDEVRAFGEDGAPPPLFVLTGGDPLKRPDVLELIAYGTRIGLRVAMTPSGTPLMTRDVLAELKGAGLARLAVSLDGATRAVHDAFRRVDGSFAWTVSMLRAARELGLPTQVNTTITRRTLGDLEAMAALVADVGAVLWSVFLVVPTGRAQLADAPSPEEVERAFEWLAARAERAPFDVKTTAAPHYRRVLLQRQVAARRAARVAGADEAPLVGGVGFTLGGARPAAHAAAALPPDLVGRAKGVNDGNGFVFVSHRGVVYPSGFLPEPCGNVRRERLRDVYREHPTFVALRDADALKGKCGVCEFRHVCGGSRARAHAMTGDWLEADPLCAYEPPAWRRAVVGRAEGARESSRTGSLVLGTEECRAVLARVGWGVLATVGDGQPYGVPVGYALGRDCVYLASGPGRKRTNVERDPRVCLTVCEIATYDAWRSVVIAGEVAPVEGLAERAAAVAAFVAQRSPRARATDASRLLSARLLRLPLGGMTGRGRGDAD